MGIDKKPKLSKIPILVVQHVDRQAHNLSDVYLRTTTYKNTNVK